MGYRKKYSKTITSDSSIRHVAVRVDFPYFRIPVSWSVIEDPDVEEVEGKNLQDERWVFVPEVKSGPIKQLDPFKLRSQFLKLDIDDEDQTLDFLNYIGVWNINEQTGAGADSMRIERAVGHRYVSGYAAYFTVGELKRAQKRAEHQMRQLETNRDKLRASFGPPPHQDAEEVDHLDHAARTRALNDFHFEWKQQPIGVIQAVTGHEMLSVTLQIDLFTGAKVDVCEKCHVRFTADPKRRYCNDLCMRAAKQKEHRAKLAEMKKKLFALGHEFHIPKGDIKKASYEKFGVASLTKLKVGQLDELAVWVANKAEQKSKYKNKKWEAKTV